MTLAQALRDVSCAYYTSTPACCSTGLRVHATRSDCTGHQAISERDITCDNVNSVFINIILLPSYDVRAELPGFARDHCSIIISISAFYF